MELTSEQVIDLFKTLGRIEQRQEAFEQAMSTPGALCAVHVEQIKEMGQALGDVKKEIATIHGKLSAVQTVIGKKELIVACFGALGFGTMWALKALAAVVATKVSTG